jgi:hypothetical protein
MGSGVPRRIDSEGWVGWSVVVGVPEVAVADVGQQHHPVRPQVVECAPCLDESAVDVG